MQSNKMEALENKKGTKRLGAVASASVRKEIFVKFEVVTIFRKLVTLISENLLSSELLFFLHKNIIAEMVWLCW